MTCKMCFIGYSHVQEKTFYLILCAVDLVNSLDHTRKVKPLTHMNSESSTS
jgi:hypothetical protein